MGTLRALFFISAVSCVVAAGDGNTESETERRIEHLEDRVLRLNAEVVGLEAELEEFREAYSGAHVAAQQSSNELTMLRLKVASLLVSKKELAATEAVILALDEMKRLQAAHDESYRDLREFQSSLTEALEVLDPSGKSPAREVLQSKLGHMIGRLERADTLLALPVVEGNLSECQVVAIDRELSVVALNVGFNHGALPGMVGRLEGIGGLECEFRIVEVRPTISGAMVTIGNLSAIGPGAVARLATKPSEQRND